MGIEPTWDSCEPLTGFEDQGHHQTPVTSDLCLLTLVPGKTRPLVPMLRMGTHCPDAPRRRGAPISPDIQILSGTAPTLGYHNPTDTPIVSEFLLHVVIEHHDRRASEGDALPGGLFDFVGRKALLPSFCDVILYARLALCQHG